MKILVAFGTSEGQTRKIAEAVAARVRDLGHDVHLYDTASSPADLHVGSFDKVIIAASVHQQRHQDSVEDFVTAKLAELQKRPTLFLSISLSAAFPEGIPDAKSYVEEFLKSTSWKPTQFLLVAGALRYTEYDYFKEQILEHVVLKGRKVEGRKGDHEFTDWDFLFRTIETFVRS
jgi:menaquinone-dependent protoporphyrinogen oxidase